jgi:hypothetical protein
MLATSYGGGEGHSFRDAGRQVRLHKGRIVASCVRTWAPHMQLWGEGATPGRGRKMRTAGCQDLKVLPQGSDMGSWWV